MPDKPRVGTPPEFVSPTWFQIDQFRIINFQKDILGVIGPGHKGLMRKTACRKHAYSRFSPAHKASTRARAKPVSFIGELPYWGQKLTNRNVGQMTNLPPAVALNSCPNSTMRQSKQGCSDDRRRSFLMNRYYLSSTADASSETSTGDVEARICN